MQDITTIEAAFPSVGIDRADFGQLFAALLARGYQLVGPTIEAGTIVYNTLEKVGDLPIGWTDRQETGSYRLERRRDEALFGYNLGPHSWKKFLFPSRQRLWQGQRNGNGSFTTQTEELIEAPYALIGVRACELRAIQIQDVVLLNGNYPDPAYAERRNNTFIVAVNCGQASSNCFCSSVGAGPKADSGYDIALTEVLEDKRHYFIANAGTESGASVLQEVTHWLAGEPEIAAAAACIRQAETAMEPVLETEGIPELLYNSYDNPHWAKLEERCLACGNCTMSCPTCFCTKVEDLTDLSGTHAERRRSWDSCFTMDFSYIHGGSVRNSIRSRYRQWLTHKFCTWPEQFGSLGCVGCGRCISWCPVGIDLRKELKAIQIQAGRKQKKKIYDYKIK